MRLLAKEPSQVLKVIESTHSCKHNHVHTNLQISTNREGSCAQDPYVCAVLLQKTSVCVDSFAKEPSQVIESTYTRTHKHTNTQKHTQNTSKHAETHTKTRTKIVRLLQPHCTRSDLVCRYVNSVSHTLRCVSVVISIKTCVYLNYLRLRRHPPSDRCRPTHPLVCPKRAGVGCAFHRDKAALEGESI